MQYLKADTAVKVVVGPCVAVGDGFTPVTTLSLSTADEAEILKHDAAAVTSISGNTFAAITSADGYYNLTLTVAQVDTEGMLTVLINDDSLCLPLRHDFMVVNANVFDSLFAASGTDLLDTQVAGIDVNAMAYPDGMIHLDSVQGTAGSTLGTNGTIDTPCTLIADAVTLANALNVTEIKVHNGSTVTLVATITNFTLRGDDWALDCNGQNITACRFYGATIEASQTFAVTGLIDYPKFFNCKFFHQLTGPGADFHDCDFNIMTVTANANGLWKFHDCWFGDQTLTATQFDFNKASVSGSPGVDMNFFNAHGMISIKNVHADHQSAAYLTGMGNVTTQSSVAGGFLTLTGNWVHANSGTWGAVTEDGNITQANINAQADAAIETYHLDHLLAVDYDPASKPGVATALLNELVEDDSGVSRYTANALEQAPSGGLTSQNVRDAMKLAPTAGSPAAGSVDEHLDDIDTATAGLAGAAMRGTDGANTTTPPTATAIATEIMDTVYETGRTLREHLRLAASALWGKASGLETTSAVYRDQNDTKNRITATVDVDGNRTAVTTDDT